MFFQIKNIKPQGDHDKAKFTHLFVNIHEKRSIRTPQFTFSWGKKCKGTLTVETALVLPLFIFVVIWITFLMDVMNYQDKVHQSLHHAARLWGQEVYSNQNKPNMSAVMIRLEIKKALENSVNNQYMLNQINELELKHVQYFENSNELYLQVEYKVDVPVPHIGSRYLKLSEQLLVRAWTGFIPDIGSNQDKEVYVYVTRNGSVYHRTLLCTHLNLSITLVEKSQVGQMRNSGGGKYKMCQVCKEKNLDNSKVYITKDGERFHFQLNCSGLMRYVREVPLSDAKGFRGCTRCVN